MPANPRRVSVLIVFALAVAGLFLRAPVHESRAGGGFPPQVLTLKSDVPAATVVLQPMAGARVVAELRPGDRVLRTNGGIAPRDEGVYIPVYTATGDAGWLLNGESIAETISPVYATSSAMQRGVVLTVSAETPVSCQTDPSFDAALERTLVTGDQGTITGGPYPAELGLWWRVTLPDGAACWLYDAPTRFSVSP